MAKDLAPDWILKETLSTQKDAHNNWARSKNLDDGLTLTALGCGTMGIAILGGILDSLQQSSTSTTTSDPSIPKRLPTKFHACVRTPASASRISSALDKYNPNLTIHQNSNLPALEAADIVLLGCKPYMVTSILSSSGVKSALAGKLLISICAGVTEAALHAALYPETIPASTPSNPCTIVRAMPNTAAAVRESMTVIATPSLPPLSPERETLVNWMFSQIGRVVSLPASTMDASTALCGSGPAFAAVFIESLAAGGIAMGLPRDEAYVMAAQTVRGAAGLVLAGEHPALVRDKVTTPGGCTIGGLCVLEEGGVRGSVSRAVREAAVVAGQLGKGVQGVNGTWGR